jgi:hypothetical protein
MMSVTALWVYDYFLTVEDEVAEFPDDDDDDAERNLTTLYRSVTYGKRRALSVRKPSHFRSGVPC